MALSTTPPHSIAEYKQSTITIERRLITILAVRSKRKAKQGASARGTAEEGVQDVDGSALRSFTLRWNHLVGKE